MQLLKNKYEQRLKRETTRSDAIINSSENVVLSFSCVEVEVGLGRSLLKEEEADEVEKKENKTHPLLTSLLFSVRDTLFLWFLLSTQLGGGGFIRTITSPLTILFLLLCFVFASRRLPNSPTLKRLSVKKDKITRKHGREMHGRRKTRVGKKFHFWIYRKTGSVCVCFSRG